MSLLLDPQDSRYRLGVESMDQTHREFMDLVNRLAAADKQTFIKGFADLVEHTRRHFESENTLMQESGFPALREHRDEHLRVLGEMERLGLKVAEGSILIARSYVREQLPAWFRLHAATMDSATAAHLKGAGFIRRVQLSS